MSSHNSSDSAAHLPVEARLLAYEEKRKLKLQQTIAQEKNEARRAANPTIAPHSSNLVQRRVAAVARGEEAPQLSNRRIAAGDTPGILKDNVTGQTYFQVYECCVRQLFVSWSSQLLLHGHMCCADGQTSLSTFQTVSCRSLVVTFFATSYLSSPTFKPTAQVEPQVRADRLADPAQQRAHRGPVGGQGQAAAAEAVAEEPVAEGPVAGEAAADESDTPLATPETAEAPSVEVVFVDARVPDVALKTTGLRGPTTSCRQPTTVPCRSTMGTVIRGRSRGSMSTRGLT